MFGYVYIQYVRSIQTRSWTDIYMLVCHYGHFDSTGDLDVGRPRVVEIAYCLGTASPLHLACSIGKLALRSNEPKTK